MKSQKGKENKGNLIGSNNVDSTNQFDGSLSCENDNDFSCAQWNENRDLAILTNHLNNVQYTLTVTQSMLDANTYAANFIAGMLALTPQAKFGQLLNVFTRDAVIKKLNTYIAAAAGIHLSITLSEVLQSILNNGLKVGDVITMKGGKVVSVKRTSITTDGGSTGSGGNDTGTSISNGMTLGDMFPNIRNLKIRCVLVKTKSSDGVYISQEVCYLE